MIEVPVYNMEGEQVSTVNVEESKFGEKVRPHLLKQALVRYHANRRQGTATTRSRSMVVGSTRKLFKQKGTGNARMGNARTVIRRGGGVAFAKVNKDWRQRMPKKMRRLARDSAILSKLQDGQAVVVEGLKFEAPKTSEMARVLDRLKVDRGCLVALHQPEETIFKSLRNLPRTDVCLLEELNAFNICRRQKLVFTKEAFDRLIGEEEAQHGNA